MWGSVTARGLRGLAFYDFESQDVNSALLLTKPTPDLNFHAGALSVSGLHTAFSRWVFLGLSRLGPQVFLVFMSVGGCTGLVGTLDTVALGASHFLVMILKLYILRTTPQQRHCPPQSTVSGGRRPVCVINGDVTLDHKEEAMSSSAHTIQL